MSDHHKCVTYRYNKSIDDYVCEVCGELLDDHTIVDEWDTRYCARCAGSGFLEELLGDCPDCDGMGLKPEYW